MNINRDNYEEYFLLYADNELPAEEMNIVAAFLADNPDLKEEMLMLQNVVIEPEQIVFEDKKRLLKPEPVDAELQQQLLLLLDNELSPNHKHYIKSLSKYDEPVRKEWGLLQQVKLSPGDFIVFTDKASLYKKEEGRVIAFRWWKVAVAAMLIGLGIWGAVSYNKKTTWISVNETVSSSNKGIKPVKKPVTDTHAVQVLSSDTLKQQEISATVIPQNNRNNKLPEKVLQPEIKIPHQPSVQKTSDPVVQQRKNNNVLPFDPVQAEEPVFKNLNNSVGNNKDVVNVQTVKNDNSAENKMMTAGTVTVNTSFEDNNDSKKSFASFDNEDENDRPRKTRLGSFFKKVKRVLERNVNIKTGGDNNIKIANMSFAMQ